MDPVLIFGIWFLGAVFGAVGTYVLRPTPADPPADPPRAIGFHAIMDSPERQ